MSVERAASGAPQGAWRATRYGGFQLRGRECLILVEPRPSYCDRGNWLAYLDLDAGSSLRLEIDDADLWPRFYFDETRAKLEIEAWLKKRGQWVESAQERSATP